MDTTVLVVFLFVYAGMILGGIPGLRLDRTGVAVLGAIALIAFETITPQAAWSAVDVPTIALLFGLMVVSAQFHFGGFYTVLTRRLAAARVEPPTLLLLLVLAAGGLSAVLTNDVVCLAMAPILIEGCARRRLDPRPFLLALACSANVGSAATLIGNPQIILIGQSLSLSFVRYLLQGGVPALLGLFATWAIIVRVYRGRWQRETVVAPVQAPPYDAFQTWKGALVLGVLVALFLSNHWPRETLALGAAGILLLSRRLRSREVLGLVDWQLLVLFIGLFVVNHALAVSGASERWVAELGAHGVDLARPECLFVVAVLLSNVVSNVPAIMLLLPAARDPMAGPVLALASTLAGNLLVIGSIANIIVIDQAERLGVKIGWREHARVGVPVTLATLTIAAVWLAFLARA